MKKLVSFICSAALLAVAALSLSACGGQATVNYKLSEDGTHYIVSGVSGNTRSLSKYEVPCEYCAEEGGELLPVKEIGDEAFRGCSSLSDIILPEGIERIGARAFMNCSFRNFTIPESVTQIGYGAFGMCTALKEIIIPQSVTQIESYAFAYCGNLETVIIKSGITQLNPRTFANSYTVAAGNVYTDTSLKTVYLPASLTKMYFDAWEGNMIEEIYFIGDEEQWDKLYFYKNEKIEGSEEYTEKKVEKSAVLGTNVQFYFNAEYPSD